MAEAVTRSPGYAFETLGQVVSHRLGAVQHRHRGCRVHLSLCPVARSRECRRQSCLLLFDYSSGDAAGQNMVTIATHAAHQYILESCLIKPEYALLIPTSPGTKARAISFSVRGKKVSAEVLLPGALIQKVLHNSRANGGLLANVCSWWHSDGSIGIQGHLPMAWQGCTRLWARCCPCC